MITKLCEVGQLNIPGIMYSDIIEHHRIEKVKKTFKFDSLNYYVQPCWIPGDEPAHPDSINYINFLVSAEPGPLDINEAFVYIKNFMITAERK